MENDPIWIRTLEDGVLLFKNVSTDLAETDKEEREDEELKHSEDNCHINFDGEDKLLKSGLKYYHLDLKKLCTVTERVEDDDGNVLKYTYKVSNEEEEKELTVDESKVLKDHIELDLRIVSKTGNKQTLNGPVFLNKPIMESTKTILELSELKPYSFKIFYNDKVLNGEVKLEDIYDSEKGLVLVAFESLGAPSKWRRFNQVYTDGSISNYYYYEDSIYFVPQKNILFTGFATWASKDGQPFQMKYHVEVDGAMIQSDDEPTTYSNFVDTYYIQIWLKKPHEVKAGQKIKLKTWYSLDFNNQSWAYLYTGNDGDNWASHPNEHMGLFHIEASETTNGYTYVGSGQFPEIYYYL